MDDTNIINLTTNLAPYYAYLSSLADLLTDITTGEPWQTSST